MGFLRRLADRFDNPPAQMQDGEERAVSLKDPFYTERLGGLGTQSGQMVTPDKASGVAIVHACVQLISETTATLPLAPYRRLSNGDRELDRDHPLYEVLHEQANRVQTAMEFREQLAAATLLTGNAFAEKIIGPDGAVRELIPIPPDSVIVERLVNGRLRYQVHETGRARVLTQDEMLHLKYRSRDGVTGISPIAVAREAIGTALAQQEHEGALYRNGLQTAGTVTFPGVAFKTNEEQSQFRNAMQEAFSGANKFRLMLLSQGATYQPISMSNEDAQFIESRKLNLEDICRIFRVPPPAVGILDKATYSNITEQSRWLVAYCLRPWLVRIEQAMNSSLLSLDGRRTHFIEHNAEGLLRGDQQQRFAAYAIGKQNGWLSANEIRQTENLNAIPGGDSYESTTQTKAV